MRNEAMLRKVGDYILNENRYQQGDWGALKLTTPEQVLGAIPSGVVADAVGLNGTDNLFMVSIDCGSYCCVAGTAALLDPATTAWVGDKDDVNYALEQLSADGSSIEAGYVVNAGVIRHIDELGREVLGLRQEETRELFAPEWRPAGWHHEMSDDDTRALVRDALYRLADGAAIHEVTH